MRGKRSMMHSYADISRKNCFICRRRISLLRGTKFHAATRNMRGKRTFASQLAAAITRDLRAL